MIAIEGSEAAVFSFLSFFLFFFFSQISPISLQPRFYMATSSEDGSVKLWDLRKLSNFQTLEGNGNAVRSVAFDWSGQYIAAASGADVAVFHGTKKFEPLATYAAHTEPVTTVRFGPNASFVASVSMDRTFKVFGALPQ